VIVAATIQEPDEDDRRGAINLLAPTIVARQRQINTTA
jgi:hypothetical protein